MRIAQVVLEPASAYERKCQRIDFAGLAPKHEVLVVALGEVRASGAQIAHIYAAGELPRAPFVRFPVPYAASVPLKKARWSLQKPVEPGCVATPFELPEAVEDAYFDAGGGQRAAGGQVKVVGSFRRESVRPMIEQALHRLQRTRDDVEWRVFDEPPAPATLAGVDLWVDPAASEEDFDGFVAEALVMGIPVVATRTAINVHRLEKGRTGLLVPLNDPNEMTHAILSALFKPEVASNKVTAARQTASKFRVRQRLRVLAQLYETLNR